MMLVYRPDAHGIGAIAQLVMAQDHAKSPENALVQKAAQVLQDLFLAYLDMFCPRLEGFGLYFQTLQGTLQEFAFGAT